MDEAKKKAQATYNFAADTFDHPANSYWDRYGRGTVERLDLNPGSRVLDLACGTGASAIPAAEAVGPTGQVLGLDLAERMLEVARQKASTKGLGHASFQYGDMTNLPYESEFHGVICVFGVFFVPNMEELVTTMWKTLLPGGRLAVTTWGPRLFEPLYGAFDRSVKARRPDLVSEFRPWDRLIEPEQVRRLLEVTGSKAISAEPESGVQPLGSPEDWWQVVLGSGLRSVVEAMGEQASEVREECFEFFQKEGIQEMETNVVYGVATK